MRNKHYWRGKHRLSDAAARQGKPSTDGDTRDLRWRHEKDHPQSLERAGPSRHPDFTLPASKLRDKKLLWLWASQFMVLCSGSPSKLTQWHTNISLAGWLSESGYVGRCEHCSSGTDRLPFLVRSIGGKYQAISIPFQGKVTAQRWVLAPGLCYSHGGVHYVSPHPLGRSQWVAGAALLCLEWKQLQARLRLSSPFWPSRF